MFSLPLDNSYVLLAALLSPCKREEHLQELRRLMAGNCIAWPALIYQANLQLCTPLLYVRLKQDGLLALLPDDLQEYLEYLNQANAERNAEMQQGLEELLLTFKQRGIKSLLLKGSTTFCDDLYGDIGARMMQDLDILVELTHVQAARQVMLDLGYEEDVLSWGDHRHHHHLPSFHKPSTHIVVEIHFKVYSGRIGWLLPVSGAWVQSVDVLVGGVASRMLNPTWRLLHNTANASLGVREFIRGNISLLQLSEFCNLSLRYQGQIDWVEYRRLARSHGLQTEFAVYLELARSLMFLPMDCEELNSVVVKFHQRRIVAMGKSLNMRSRGALLMGKIYYFMKLPFWVWCNARYVEGVNNHFERVIYLLKRWRHEGHPE